MNRGYYLHYKNCIAREQQRVAAIKELIEREEVESCEQLVQLLKEKGVDTDVTTVTRDLQALQVRKGPSGACVLPDPAELERRRNRLREALQASTLDISTDVEFLAIRTSAGQADALAAAIEECLEERVLGVIAGRDTVLVIAKDDAVGREALQEVRDLYA